MELSNMRLIDAANKLNCTEEYVYNNLKAKGIDMPLDEYALISVEAEYEVKKMILSGEDIHIEAPRKEVCIKSKDITKEVNINKLSNMRLIDAANKLNCTEEYVYNNLKAKGIDMPLDEYALISVEAECEVKKMILSGEDIPIEAPRKEVCIKSKDITKEVNINKLSNMRLIDAANKLNCTEEYVYNNLKAKGIDMPLDEYALISVEAEYEVKKMISAKEQSSIVEIKKEVEVEMETPLTAEELSYLTGLSTSECKHFMDVNHMDGDEAFEAIDIFMQSLNDDIAAPIEIASCINNAGIYTKMSNRLGSYNTMRGGTKGYGGFVFEELHAADAATKGVNINVLGNNGPADFIVKDVSGKEILVQAKAGYKPGQIDWSKYEDMTIVVDKGNTALANEARSMGLVVEESSVYKKQADIVARTQQWESKITGSKTAPITAKATGAHYAGMASAKFAARVGVSTKLGENIYDVISGEKNFSDAVSDVAFDSIKLVGSAYVSGAALSLAGGVVTGAVGTAAAAVGSTAVGGVVTGAVGTAVAAVGSTAVGGVALTAAGAVASGVATATAAVTGAAFLPVVAAGAAVGFISKWFRNK